MANYYYPKEKKEKMIGNLTCPKCRHKQRMKIPTSLCQALYKCEGCGKKIFAEKSCCVFCEYSDRKCPLIEEHRK